jgi:hypothetical protein
VTIDRTTEASPLYLDLIKKNLIGALAIDLADDNSNRMYAAERTFFVT